MPGGSAVLPFVRLFYGQPSRYLWEDEDGAIHHIHQCEGGEQGDPLMPLLFSLGQHAALETARRRLRVGERLFAFLDDIYVTTTPERAGIVHNILEQKLCRHSRIHIHVGKTQVWNAAGVRSPACDQLERLAQVSDPEARVWKGSDIPTVEQGVRILGTPLGHLDYVHTFLQNVLDEHAVLLSRIPLVEDVQSAWALLLHCADGRANCTLRVVMPEAVQRFAEGHTNGLFASVFGGGHWFEEHRTDEPTSVLGKLGGLPGHAQGTTPGCGCVVCPSDAEPSRTTVIGVSSDGGRAVIGSGRVPRSRPWFAPPRT